MSGPSASSINGIYEVTNEINGGWPVYRKRGDPDKWLEFIVATSEWYVKPTTDRGRPEGWMCIPSDPPTRPELCIGTCEVWDGEKWVIQETVTVLKAVNGFDSMAEFRVFCEEEILSLNERLNSSLKRVVELLSIPHEKLEEETKEVNNLIERSHQRLQHLRNELTQQRSIETTPPAPVTLTDGIALY